MSWLFYGRLYALSLLLFNFQNMCTNKNNIVSLILVIFQKAKAMYGRMNASNDIKLQFPHFLKIHKDSFRTAGSSNELKDCTCFLKLIERSFGCRHCLQFLQSRSWNFVSVLSTVTAGSPGQTFIGISSCVPKLHNALSWNKFFASLRYWIIVLHPFLGHRNQRNVDPFRRYTLTEYLNVFWFTAFNSF